MIEDLKSYMEAQGDPRLIFIVKDAENYADGVGEAAKNELLARGYSTEDIRELLNSEEQFLSKTKSGGPLDAVWLKSHEMRSAKGLLLMVVLLLVFAVIKTLLVHAVLVYRFGAQFSFKVSLIDIFFPMTLGAFAAYAIWKLMSAGWIAGHAFAYFAIASASFRAMDVWTIYSIQRQRDFSPEVAQIDVNASLLVILDLALAIFIIVQLNRRENLQFFELNRRTKVLTRFLLPIIVFILLGWIKFGMI